MGKEINIHALALTRLNPAFLRQDQRLAVIQNRTAILRQNTVLKSTCAIYTIKCSGGTA